MKTLLKTIAISSMLSALLLADPIDGTLAVDNRNENTLSSQQLDAMLDDNTNKDVQAAQSIPATPSNYLSNYMEGPFVGLELNGVTSVKLKNSNEDVTGLSWGLRFGAQNLEWRTMAILERFDNDDYSYTKGTIQLDYFFLGADNLMVDTYAFRPYVGINAGLFDGFNLIYGAQLGATMNLTQHVDLDLGLRYDLASDKIDHTSNISAGLHYKY